MSVWSDDIATTDNLLHVLGGSAFALALVAGYWWPPSLSISVPIVLVAFGLLREVAQADNDWAAPFKSLHKAVEGLSWGVGGILVMGVGLLIFLFGCRPASLNSRCIAGTLTARGSVVLNLPGTVVHNEGYRPPIKQGDLIVDGECEF